MKRITFLFKRLLFHPHKLLRTLITVVYCLAGVATNFFLFQVFCVPVWPAAIGCVLFFIAIVYLPFASNKSLKLALYFVIGTGIPICAYCIWFLMDVWDTRFPIAYYLLAYVLLGLFFGLGLLAYIPVYLLYHVYKYYKIGLANERIALVSGCMLPLIALAFYLVQFEKQYAAFDEAVRHKKVTSIPANYFTERLLGIGFKYHTQLEFVYDGWRPPMHDPFLNLGLRFFAMSSYPFQSLNRIKYYKVLFPRMPLKVNCPCSYMSDGATYLSGDWQRYLYYEQ